MRAGTMASLCKLATVWERRRFALITRLVLRLNLYGMESMLDCSHSTRRRSFALIRSEPRSRADEKEIPGNAVNFASRYFVGIHVR